MAANGKHTTEMMHQSLRDAKTYREFETQYRDRFINPALMSLIRDTIARKGLVKAEVIRRADLDRTYGYQLLRGIRKPTRRKLIQLAFGLRMNAEEAEALFRAAEVAPLYPKVEDEAATLFCLGKGYTYPECAMFLEELHHRGDGPNADGRGEPDDDPKDDHE